MTMLGVSSGERETKRIVRLKQIAAKVLPLLMLAAGLLAALPGAARADHRSYFSQFEGTKTCLECHRQQAQEMHGSVHYQWKGNASRAEGLDTDWVGKLGGINDFCIYPDINWLGQMTTTQGAVVDGGCAKCHTGLGSRPEQAASQDQLENIDCLMCHSDQYARKVENVGGQWRQVPNEAKMSVSLLEAAWNVQRPGNASCLRCHTHAGGGDNFKRGDLSTAQVDPSPDLDVHLASRANGGVGLTCVSCHTTTKHRIAGRGSDLRPMETQRDLLCSDCHTTQPHGDSQLNRHTARVDCRTCHIPSFARQIPTDMNRDYSAPAVLNHVGLYEAEMEFHTNVEPVYAFFNGRSRFYNFGSPATPGSDGRVVMSEPLGSNGENGARIQPFKLHLATQPQDPVTGALLPLKMKIWFETGDLPTAAQQGVAAAGMEWHGYTFAHTKRYMAINHQVARKEQALSCNDCHNGGNRLDFAALGYATRQTRNSKPLCSSCHEDKSGEWSNSQMFTRVHDKHVGGGGGEEDDSRNYDCSECHNFSRAQTTNQANSVRVVLNPAAVDKGGMFRIDGGSWKTSGTLVSGLAAGNHLVDFKPVSGMQAPYALNISLPQLRTLELTGFYLDGATAAALGGLNGVYPLLID